MNRNEAYNACHEMMLENKNYVPYENAGITYLMVQISDREDEIGIQAFLVNPAIPGEGGIRAFADMTDDQQIGILSLPPVTKAIRNSHQKLLKMKALSCNEETREDAITLLKQAMSGLSST